MNSGRFIFSSCLKRIRPLYTPENGATDEIVASSWIDALAGLSRWNTRNVPPDFCASAEELRKQATSAAAAMKETQKRTGIFPLFAYVIRPPNHHPGEGRDPRRQPQKRLNSGSRPSPG